MNRLEAREHPRRSAPQVGRLLLWFACLFAMETGTRTATAADASNDGGTAIAGRRTDNDVTCGPNCLYMLLRLYGIPVTAQLIDQCTPKDARGSSLLELRDQATARGLPCDVVRLQPDQIMQNLSGPVILYCRAAPYVGHYVVAVRVHDGRLRIIDGTTAQVEDMSAVDLSGFFSGIALVPSPIDRYAWIGRLPFVSAATILFVTLMLAIRRRSHARWPFRRASIGSGHQPVGATGAGHATNAASLLCWVLVWSLSLLAGQVKAEGSHVQDPVGNPATARLVGQAEIPDSWRQPQNDGINCLYIQLRLLGYQHTYEELWQLARDKRPPLSLRDLSDIAHRAGFELVPVRLTCPELGALDKPILVHQEEEGLDAGNFSLIVWYEPDIVTLIAGGTVTWRELQRSDFDRGYSGFALSAAKPGEVSPNIRRGCCGALALLAAVVGVRRARAPWLRGTV